MNFIFWFLNFKSSCPRGVCKTVTYKQFTNFIEKQPYSFLSKVTKKFTNKRLRRILRDEALKDSSK